VTAQKRLYLVISDFNVEPFADYLRQGTDGSACEVVVAPFGQVAPVLIEIGSGTSDRSYDAVMVWTQPEAVIPGYGALLRYEAVSESEILSQVAQFADLIVNAAQRSKHVFVSSWSQPHFHRALGVCGMRAEGSVRMLLKMNLELCERLSRQSNGYVLNSNSWLASAGSNAYNAKLWYLAKMPFALEVFEAAAKDFRAAIETIEGRGRKLIVLDLDDTLWGGIVGEVGWENLRIGGHDPIGEAFADFQKALKALSQTGIVLAIASKNDEAVALEAIDKHPEMILRGFDFAAWRINWLDKAENIADIASTLNLDLSSIVYIDDSPAERSRVRTALPAVAVPDWPQDAFLYASYLTELSYFDKVAITTEDRQRTSMYIADVERTGTRHSFQSIEDWLHSLGMEIEIEELSQANLGRATQLFNKTNQMNLSTRRLAEEELWKWSLATENQFYVFRVCDKFGDYGLTGILGLTSQNGEMKITDYLLSCRVMGRGVERLMLGFAIDRARKAGMTEIRAEYLPTAKNAPCLSFFRNTSGLEHGGGNRFVWRVANEYPWPAHISVTRSDATGK